MRTCLRPPQRWRLRSSTAEAIAAGAGRRSASAPGAGGAAGGARHHRSRRGASPSSIRMWAQLHDPLLMLGMASAVERLERAIAQREPILLYGDYDVDGTTAVVLLKTAIEMLGGEARFHVPHRLREGYGLQSSVLEAAYADGVRLVITVDTGMRAFAEAEAARTPRPRPDRHRSSSCLKADDAVPHRIGDSQSQPARLRLSGEIVYAARPSRSSLRRRCSSAAT